MADIIQARVLFPQTGVVTPVDLEENDLVYYDLKVQEIVRVIRGAVVVFEKAENG